MKKILFIVLIAFSCKQKEATPKYTVIENTPPKYTVIVDTPIYTFTGNPNIEIGLISMDSMNPEGPFKVFIMDAVAQEINLNTINDSIDGVSDGHYNLYNDDTGIAPQPDSTYSISGRGVWKAKPHKDSGYGKEYSAVMRDGPIDKSKYSTLENDSIVYIFNLDSIKSNNQ